MNGLAEHAGFWVVILPSVHRYDWRHYLLSKRREPVSDATSHPRGQKSSVSPLYKRRDLRSARLAHQTLGSVEFCATGCWIYIRWTVRACVFFFSFLSQIEHISMPPLLSNTTCFKVQCSQYGYRFAIYIQLTFTFNLLSTKLLTN
jgi:hypothetical protein